MTVCERMISKINECLTKAIEFSKKDDWYMATFWKNASIGFERKLMNMTILQLKENV